MKKLITLSFVLISSVVLAQETKIVLNDLYIPDAPGLLLADKSPSFIDKPATPRALAFSLINLGEGGALSVSPFWLSDKPQYTYEDWIAKQFVFKETFTISVASYKASDNFTFAPGIRAQLFRWYSRKSIADLKAKKAAIVALLGTIPLDEAAIKKAHEDLNKTALKGVFAIELAGAVLANSTGSLFKNSSIGKSGLWTNIRWDPATFPLGIVGLARYAWDENGNGTNEKSQFLDFGIGLNYSVTKFSFTGEYVNRKDYAADHNYTRLALVANYALTDNIMVVASSGKDLKTNNEVLTLFGVKFGLARNAAK